MKITLPLILKKNRNGVGQAQQSNNVVARGLLDISLGSEEDIQTPREVVDPFEQAVVKSVRHQRYNPNTSSGTMMRSYKAPSLNIVSPTIVDVDDYNDDISEVYSQITGSVSCSTQTSSNTGNYSNTDLHTNAGIESHTISCDTDESKTPKFSSNLLKNQKRAQQQTNTKSLAPIPSPQHNYAPGSTPQHTLEALAEMQCIRSGNKSVVTPNAYLNKDGPRKVLFQDESDNEDAIMASDQKGVKISIVSRKDESTKGADSNRSDELLKSLAPVFSFLEKILDGGCDGSVRFHDSIPRCKLNHSHLIPDLNIDESQSENEDDGQHIPEPEEEGIEVLLTSYEPAQKTKEKEKKSKKGSNPKKRVSKKERRKITPLKLNLSVVLEESFDCDNIDENDNPQMLPGADIPNPPEFDLSWNLDTSRQSNGDDGDSWVGSLIWTPPKETKVALSIEEKCSDENGNTILNVSVESISSDGSAWNCGKEKEFVVANDPPLDISLSSSSSGQNVSSSSIINITLDSEESKALLKAIEKQERQVSESSNKIKGSFQPHVEDECNDEFFVEDSFASRTELEEERNISFGEIDPIYSCHQNIDESFESGEMNVDVAENLEAFASYSKNYYLYDQKESPPVVAHSNVGSSVLSLAQQFEGSVKVEKSQKMSESEKLCEDKIDVKKPGNSANHRSSAISNEMHSLQRKALSVLSENVIINYNDKSSTQPEVFSRKFVVKSGRKPGSGIAARIAAFEKVSSNISSS